MTAVGNTGPGSEETPVPLTAPEVRFGYLGPEGTFTEAALKQYAPEQVGTPYLDVISVLKAVRNGEIDAAVVPIENSVEGGVNATLDGLSNGDSLVIVGEVLIPITFVLARAPGADGEIRRIGTHPHGWAQVRNWLHENIPNAEHVPTSSTAAAAAAIAEGTADFDAALCSAISAEKYGLTVVAAGLADNRNAITRFVVVARPSRLPEPTGADKTTLMVHLGHNEAGGLLEMLEQFAVRGVNLSRIESRPIGDSLGRYGFSIDVEGHVKEERLQAVLIGLHLVCPVIKFLGSYPAADRRRPVIRPGMSESDLVAARNWVSSLLEEHGEPVVLAERAVPSELAADTSQLEPADSKSRIMVAATQEFAAYGYDGASMRRIASAAQADPGLIPYHFGGKRGLFQSAVLDSLLSKEALAEIMARRELSPVVSAYSANELGSRSVLAAVLRTAIAPSSSLDSYQQETAERLAASMRASIEGSLDVEASHVLLRTFLGCVYLRDVVPVTPLSQISRSELSALMDARIAVLDRSTVTQQDYQVESAPNQDALLNVRTVNPVSPSRDRILMAATALFGKLGAHRASLREIAAAADCDISLVHYYFGSKTGLLSAVLDQATTWGHQIEEPGSRTLEFLDAFGQPAHIGQIRATIISGANPGSTAVHEIVRSRIQRSNDLCLSSTRPDIGMGLHILHAELVGAVVLHQILTPHEALVAYEPTMALKERLLAGLTSGNSLQQLAAQS